MKTPYRPSTSNYFMAALYLIAAGALLLGLIVRFMANNAEQTTFKQIQLCVDGKVLERTDRTTLYELALEGKAVQPCGEPITK